ncbi:glycosyltransferase [Ectothiorhodospiraceae bacterium BW-2]|nr:glycosyltransferase [Ectothiorhodospiraceae bacterium BW-2]
MRCSLIISVYKDVEALLLILRALQRQSVAEFEVIISEDDADPAMAAAVQAFPHACSWQHLTQPDVGFRKNRALNRAIVAARSDWLIFIDGDCLPHREFIAAHCRYAAPHCMTAGRRVELGAHWSAELRQRPELWSALHSSRWWWRHLRSLQRDRVKGLEMALLPPILASRLPTKPLALLGSNFAVHRQDIEAVNGFDEAYQAAGVGEDSDIDWRLRRSGVVVRSVKWQALQWHLHHPRSYQPNENNWQKFQLTQQLNYIRAAKGIIKTP